MDDPYAPESAAAVHAQAVGRLKRPDVWPKPAFAKIKAEASDATSGTVVDSVEATSSKA